ncbi:MAG: ribonuclease D [Flavobacteriales bacterium]|nr:ribonuclease D [Flavobacteriales bacterium]
MHQLVQDDGSLSEAVHTLAGSRSVALDTEASSFHRYHERICLIQMSDRERTYLVDPFAVKDTDGMVALWSDPGTEIVIHDADFDLRLIKRSYGARVNKIFDTLIAAEFMNEPELSLQALLRKYAGVELDKRFQKADWSKRPLPLAMQEYAAMDTAHLLALRDLMENVLKKLGRWSWAQEEFALLTELPYRSDEAAGPGFLRIKGAKRLKGKELAVLREVHAWREGVAEQVDRAPFMVVGNEVLLQLSSSPPSNRKELAQVKGLGERNSDRYGTAILAAVERALALPKAEWPKLERPKRYKRDENYERRLKRLKERRDVLAASMELNPGVLCPNLLLAHIARTRPADLSTLRQLEGIRIWQVENLGAALLEVVD